MAAGVLPTGWSPGGKKPLVPGRWEGESVTDWLEAPTGMGRRRGLEEVKIPPGRSQGEVG